VTALSLSFLNVCFIGVRAHRELKTRILKTYHSSASLWLLVYNLGHKPGLVAKNAGGCLGCRSEREGCEQLDGGLEDEKSQTLQKENERYLSHQHLVTKMLS